MNRKKTHEYLKKKYSLYAHALIGQNKVCGPIMKKDV